MEAQTKTPCAGPSSRSGWTLLGVPRRRRGDEALVRSTGIDLLTVGFGAGHIHLQDQEVAIAFGMGQRLATARAKPEAVSRSTEVTLATGRRPGTARPRRW